jgi:hypothetical protein
MGSCAIAGHTFGNIAGQLLELLTWALSIRYGAPSRGPGVNESNEKSALGIAQTSRPSGSGSLSTLHVSLKTIVARCCAVYAGHAGSPG